MAAGGARPEPRGLPALPRARLPRAPPGPLVRAGAEPRPRCGLSLQEPGGTGGEHCPVLVPSGVGVRMGPACTGMTALSLR